MARDLARTLGQRYKLGPDSIYRHARNHLPPQLRAKLLAGPDLEIDFDRLRDTESQSLLGNLVALRHRLFAGLDVAEEVGDSSMVARVANQLHRNLEITGNLRKSPRQSFWATCPAAGLPSPTFSCSRPMS